MMKQGNLIFAKKLIHLLEGIKQNYLENRKDN